MDSSRRRIGSKRGLQEVGGTAPKNGSSGFCVGHFWAFSELREERGENLEPEVLLIPEAIGPPLDDPDRVIDSFHEPEGDLVLGVAVGSNAVPVPLDRGRELLVRGEPLLAERPEPGGQEPAGCAFVGVGPQLLHLLAEQTTTMKLQPRGFLEAEQYSKMQAEVQKAKPIRVPRGDENKLWTPSWAYTTLEERDFSQYESISIPQFKIMDPLAEETMATETLDELAKMLAHYKVFRVVDRKAKPQIDLTLEGAVLKYKRISGQERALIFLLGDPIFNYTAYSNFIAELKLTDNKNNKTVAVMQVNVARNAYVGGVQGLVHWATHGRVERDFLIWVVQMLMDIKANKRGGVSERALPPEWFDR